MAKWRYSSNLEGPRRSISRKSLYNVVVLETKTASSYTRSTSPSKGKKPEVLETKNEISYEYSKTIRASDEGVYEVVSIRDKYCAFSTQKVQGASGQKLLTNR